MRHPHSGFSLLEILVAVFVLAIGLLGFASLQVAALTGSQDNALRSQALQVATDLADRMQNNREYLGYDQRITLPSGSWATTDGNLYTPAPAQGQTWATLSCAAPTPPNPTNCTAAACRPNQQAGVDVYEICRLAAARLPTGGQVETQCNDSIALPARRNPYYGGTFGVHAWRNPQLLAAGNDNDTCSPGSRIGIRVSWPRQARTGAGEGALAGASLGGCPANRDCVLLEVQP